MAFGAFGYSPETTGSSTFNKIGENDLQDGELVDSIILEVTYPSTFKKSLQEKDLTFKDHGMQINFAVMLRNRNENVDGALKLPYEKCFVKDDTGTRLIEPKFVVYGQVTQWTPPLIYTKYPYGSKGGGTLAVKQKTGKVTPVVTDLLPSGYAVKDWDSGVRADAVPAGFEMKYAGIIEKEKIRLSKWKEILDSWDKMTEEQCKEALLTALSQRLLLCSMIVDDGVPAFVYTPPTPGLLFRSKIKREKDPKYFGVNTIEWNKTMETFDVFSTLTVASPSPELVATAKLIQDTKMENIKARMASKAVKQEYQKSEEDVF